MVFDIIEDYVILWEEVASLEREADKVSGGIRPENRVSKLGSLSLEREKKKERRDLGEGLFQ